MKKQHIFILLMGLFFANTNFAQTIKKGPYMIYPNDNSKMTILWQLSSTTSSTLSWGTTTSYGNNQSVSEYGSDHQFKYTITGLTPGTKYYYKVHFGSTDLTGSFIAAPNTNATAVKFLAYGDTRTYFEDTNDVTGRMLTEVASDADYQTFSLHVGDWVNVGKSENDWTTQFFSRTGASANNLDFHSKIPLMGVRGNHENYTPAKGSEFATVFYKYFPYTFASGSTNGDNMYYSFDYGPVHIAVLDQYDGNPYQNSIGSVQKTWLENDLANSSKPWKFVMVHEPGWSAASTTKSEHPNNTDVQNTIQPICVQNGVQVIFGGHNHYYAHSLKDGVHHFTLGGGGAPLYAPSYTSGGVVQYAEATLHFMKVDINGNNATLKVVRPDGTTVETINLTIPILNPTSFSATASSTSQIDLSWLQNSDNDDILLAYNTANTFGTPTGTYNIGDDITGGGHVIATGDIEAFYHTGLTAQTYYYKIWSKNGTDYSDGVTTSASPVVGEPTNHVTNFVAGNPTASTITLTWNDATGITIPAGYLIKAVASGGTISDPIDGTPENNSTFTQNVAQGVQTFTFSSLNSLTTYDFKIFPYTNSGAQINYKTDGTVPSASGTTTDVSLDPICEDFDTGLANSYTTGTQTLSTGDWTCQDVYQEASGASHGGTGHAVRINDDTPGGHITTPAFSNINSISFWYRELNSGGGTFTIQKSNDGTTFTTIANQAYSGQTFEEFTYDVNDASPTVYIRILSDDNPGHLIIDDFCYTPMGGSSNDVTSTVTNPTGGQPVASNINSDQTNCNSPINVFSFDVVDDGASDGNPTIITNIRLKPAATNTASWVNNIQNVKVNNGSGFISTGSVTITDNYIDIPINANDLNIGDGHSGTITIAICLNTSGLENNSVLSFKVDAANHGFIADGSGSQFANTFSADVTSNDFTIEVLCMEPTTNSSSLNFTNLQENSVTLNWTSGDGDNRIVLAKLGSDVDRVPSDNVTYQPNTVFGSGDELGVGNFVVYNGHSNSVNISGLSKANSYYFKIYEFNCGSGDENYLTTGSIASGNITTPAKVDVLNSEFKIYPNPTNGYFTIISNQKEIKRISIIDMTGKIVLEKNIYSKKSNIDMTSFSNGIYFIKIQTESFIINKKIVIQ